MLGGLIQKKKMMNKIVNLQYNLLYFDIYEEGVNMITDVKLNTLMHKVYTLLDREIGYKVNGHEVYLDKTDEVNLCNVIIKTERQTITIQIIPSIHIIDYKGVDDSLIENRKHILKQELFNYAETLLEHLLNKECLEDSIIHNKLPKVEDQLNLEHWNQLPIKFE